MPPIFMRIAALCALGIVLLACSGDTHGPPLNRTPSAGVGEPRTYEMGFSSLPREPGEDAYKEAFREAARTGEVVFIQRPPPWEDFLPGAKISSRTKRLTQLERQLAKDYNLKLFLAVDPTNPADRGQLAGLPDRLRGRDFSDPDVRAAFIAYAKYLAFNYKPAYMALGVEVDMFFNRRGDSAFRTFQSLYFEAYDAVKKESPDTLVFPTFQYEDMIGLLSGTLPAWSLVDRFDPKIDMVAISTFPGFVLNSISDMSEDYYDALQSHLQRPAAFVSVGWSSETGQTDQFTYISRVLKAADASKARLFIWYLARDPVQGPDDSFGPLAQMGLEDVNGIPKTAYSAWRHTFDRPLQP